MNYFLDTEFIERGREHPIELISIGIVSEDDREYYAISSEFVPSHANKWVKQNVLPHLGSVKPTPISKIASEICEFTETKEGSMAPRPNFWGYYADYDWVVFCQMFGSMVNLPQRMPQYCRDLKQWCDALGNPTLPKQESKEHNALADARWNLQVYKFLLSKRLFGTVTMSPQEGGS